jgi:hypothetical protein
VLRRGNGERQLGNEGNGRDGKLMIFRGLGGMTEKNGGGGRKEGSDLGEESVRKSQWMKEGKSEEESSIGRDGMMQKAEGGGREEEEENVSLCL